MKKLMIAAAAAAMVGGVFASEYVYDYTASLKTTKGKYGTQKTTYTVNLGKDDAGTFWWDDQGFANAAEGKDYIKSLSNEEKADYAWDELGFDGTKTDYNTPESYNGKDQWCATFKFTESDGACYRVATSIKVKDTVYVDDCCGDAAWEFSDDTEIDWGFGYRFGGVTFPKATKVEVVGSWENDDEEFYVAGQGTWSDKLVKVNGAYVAGVKNISGNIVGALANSECRDCCDYPTYARCFDFCEGDMFDAEDTPTAAFGTWSIKFNSKLSFK